MLRGAFALLVAAGVAASAAAALPPRPHLDSVTATLSTNRAGARPVAVSIRLYTELQCGHVRGPVTIRLPAAVRVPPTVVGTSVLVGTRPATRVLVDGHLLTVMPPRPVGVICDAIAPGMARIDLTTAANLGNPSTPGRYRLTVEYGGQVFATTLAIA